MNRHKNRGGGLTVSYIFFYKKRHKIGQNVLNLEQKPFLSVYTHPPPFLSIFFRRLWDVTGKYWPGCGKRFFNMPLIFQAYYGVWRNIFKMTDLRKPHGSERLLVFLTCVILTTGITNVLAQFDTTRVPTFTADAKSIHNKRHLYISSNIWI